jgi:hypothetical protein
MPDETGIAAVAHVIQLAVAPVFLLTGIGALLSVLTGRLGRIIDRARALESAQNAAAETKRREIAEELRVLCRRSKLINWAIILATAGALLVCAVIAALFLGVFFRIDVSTLVGWTFIAAMLALIVGLLAFLREVHIATLTMRIGGFSRGAE